MTKKDITAIEKLAKAQSIEDNELSNDYHNNLSDQDPEATGAVVTPIVSRKKHQSRNKVSQQS